ncbi:MAG: AAA family ATPase [Actinobacteria bacterium]|nr:AAA family ATPase [Actinomycetota bacterium]
MIRPPAPGTLDVEEAVASRLLLHDDELVSRDEHRIITPEQVLVADDDLRARLRAGIPRPVLLSPWGPRFADTDEPATNADLERWEEWRWTGRTLPVRWDVLRDERRMEAVFRGQTAVPDAGATWEPVDLSRVIGGGRPAVMPALLQRSDGAIALLYRGMTHAFYAEPEAGKTWFALLPVIECLQRREDVFYLDYESDEATVVGRLMAVGFNWPVIEDAIGPDTIEDGFHYFRPAEGGHGRIFDHVERYQPVLVVIDGQTEAMALNGLSINDNDDIATFNKLLPNHFARAGAAVLTLDHVTKSKEDRGRWAIGGQHKLAGITGAAYGLTVVEPMAPGRRGVVSVTVAKDRPGQVRRIAEGGKKAGQFVLDESDLLVARFDPPGDEARPQSAWDRIEAILADHGPLTVSQIGDHCADQGRPLRADTIEKALKRNGCTGGGWGQPWSLPDA